MGNAALKKRCSGGEPLAIVRPIGLPLQRSGTLGSLLSLILASAVIHLLAELLLEQFYGAILWIEVQNYEKIVYGTSKT